MTQSYNSQEVRDAVIDSLERLQDTIGGHFPWCQDYMQKVKRPCTCGMDLMRLAKARLTNERFEEYALWADALELE